MRKLSTAALLVPVMMMFWSAPGLAKNKENCKAIGGKWLPGSTTNPEKGACIFAIRQGGSGNGPVKAFGVEGAIPTEICKARGGELSPGKNECRVPMNNPADGVRLTERLRILD